MHGVGTGLGRGVENLVEDEVRLGRGLPTEGERLVGEFHEGGIGIRLRVHRDTADTGILGRPDHANGDLASVSYEYLRYPRAGMAGH